MSIMTPIWPKPTAPLAFMFSRIPGYKVRPDTPQRPVALHPTRGYQGRYPDAHSRLSPLLRDSGYCCRLRCGDGRGEAGPD